MSGLTPCGSQFEQSGYFGLTTDFFRAGGALVVFLKTIVFQATVVSFALFGATEAAMAEEAEAQDTAQIEQQRAYEALQEAPDNVAFMFRYVRASVEVKDYEAAITTLERILIYRPDLARVRVELGAAYFRLGSYAISKFYFDEALAAGGLTADEQAQVGRFLEQIERRTAKWSYAGSAMAGIVVASNANLGTSSNLVSTGGIPVLAPGNLLEREDAGLRVVVNLAHQHDLGQPDGDFWRTDAQFYALQFFNEDSGNVNVMRVRTGPRISLNPLSHGPKLRPFVEAELFRADDQSLYRGLGGGLELSDTLNADWSVFGSARFQERQFFDGRSEFDGIYSRASVGAVYNHSPTLRLRTALVLDHTEADFDFNDYTQVSLRGGFDYRYDPGFVWADRDWRAEGFIVVGRRFFDGPDARVDPNIERQDTLVRFGFGNTAFISDGFFTRLDLDYTQRKSNIANFDLNGVTLALSVGKTF